MKLLSRQALIRILLLALALGALARAQAESDEPFGFATVPDPQNGYAETWHKVGSDWAIERGQLDQCRASREFCSAAAVRFLAVIDEARGQSGRTRLAYVNRAINLAVRAKNDVANYGVAELWTTPLATLANGAGDCTDYAIAKYYALDDLGIPADDRRLVIVLDRSLTPYTPSMYHTILAVRDERRWLILDNRTMTVVDAADHPNYVPLLEFDDRGVQRLERSDKLASGGCSPNSG